MPVTKPGRCLSTALGAVRADGAVTVMRCWLAELPDAMAAHVSVENQFPADLFEAMVGFIEQCPQWDQCRPRQSALSGFLFRQGCQEKPLMRRLRH